MVAALLPEAADAADDHPSPAIKTNSGIPRTVRRARGPKPALRILRLPSGHAALPTAHRTLNAAAPQGTSPREALVLRLAGAGFALSRFRPGEAGCFEGVLGPPVLNGVDDLSVTQGVDEPSYGSLDDDAAVPAATVIRPGSDHPTASRVEYLVKISNPRLTTSTFSRDMAPAVSRVRRAKAERLNPVR